MDFLERAQGRVRKNGELEGVVMNALEEGVS